MNELRPGMFRLTPGGSGGAATAGLGKCSAARAALTLCRVISSRPTSAPAAAVTTATPLVVRNRRRAGPRETPRSSGLGRKVNEDAGVASAGPGRSGGLSSLAEVLAPADLLGRESSLCAARARTSANELKP